MTLLARSTLLLGLLLTGASALAADGDFRTGTFGGIWCNYPATYYIQSKEPNRWIFNGQVRIRQTGQLDRLWVQQYDDNSLRMIRYLSGRESGKTQSVQTFPPETVQIGGVDYYRYIGKNSYGPGCGYGTNIRIHIPVQ